MTKTKSTKRALLMSGLALMMCVAMLIGTTFAWFTDSVTSTGNIIKSGKLDVEMYWAEGTEEPDSAAWKDASKDAIFTSELWEPGYVEVRHVKIENKGTLALKYQLSIVANGVVSKLTDVIDVYYADPAVKVSDRTALTEDKKLDTLSNVLGAMSTTASGNLEAGKSDTITIALKMQESAGNEYQNLSIGSDFAVQLFATQVTSESDSFDNQYDADAAWDGTASFDWYDGESTEYTLTTAADFAGFAKIVNGTATVEEVSGIATYSNTVTYVKDSFNGETVYLESDVNLMGMEWTPIGNADNKFEGTFDGKGNTVANLNVNMPGKSNVGLFGFTTNGVVKNLVVENANIVGRLNVGVVAGTPYTSNYSNITVKGHVVVNGMAYVGGVAGKNAYADWTNITVDVDESSYVNANSVENGTAYRTYVGGVIGFMGEGSHKISNVTSNINVIGSTCDVGGIVGIAHYGNTFDNITCTGNVTITNAADAEDAEQIGGIAGVWNNTTGYKVTFNNCEFTGNLKANVTDGVNLADNTIAGASYDKAGKGELVINGVTTVVATSLADMNKAIENGAKVIDVNGANLGDFDYDAKFTDGVIVKNAKFTYFYGGDVTGTVTFENCEFVSDHSYSAHFDSGNGNIIFNNCLFDGWSSFGSAITNVEMNNCTFKWNNPYSLLRFYQSAQLNNCVFEKIEGIDTNATGYKVEFNNCIGIEGKIFNNGSNKGIWVVDGTDISDTVTSW